MAENEALQDYISEKRTMVDQALAEFIAQRYKNRGGLLEMAAHVLTKGKRLRGIMAVMVCEALGAPGERALQAACGVELAHSISLVSDDVMDNDDTRRGGLSFWQRFGYNLAVLMPHVVLPHAILAAGTYGPRAVVSVVTAWEKTAAGQALDYPKLRGRLPVAGAEYEQIISLKTAPLFECAAELGARASGREHLLRPAKGYGYWTGKAFQAYDDACDLIQADGQTWEAAAQDDLPVSLRALKALVKGQELVTAQDAEMVLALGEEFLERARTAAHAFPESEVRDLMVEFPAAGCQALLAEVSPEMAARSYPEAATGGAPQLEGA